MSIRKVYELMHSIHCKRRKEEIIELLNDSDFGGMLHICNWTKVHTFFLDWVVKNFDKENMWITLSKTEINYMEKMGKRNPFLTGKYKRPSLRDWDVKTANQDLQKVHDLMGLEHGLTTGVTQHR